MHHPFLNTNIFYLRRLEKEDLESNYFQWLNDQNITKWMRHGIFPNSYESMKNFYDSQAMSKTDVVFAIVLKEQDRHIGNIGLHSINYVFRSAEIGIIIGETDCWGKGYAAAAISLLSEHCFSRLNMNRLAAGAVDKNIGSIRAFEKAGFSREGISRQAYFCEGQYHDCVNLSLLHSEWLGKDHGSI
ncbi:GNAT family N-acetyltransferase [Sporomusa malonica]|uniref:Protein N-acetyltransferase, RimJ/RimL family n=1 Tax=Sporomusa malonica TaxID=112901 RepID=A0A1W1YV29_9FIRM|nr:GNAT family protein [Sporomusa malonica]SMC39942.1 Protein N-acetyltransferase, RimJ/RimL family [Sporomusa malonica]